jgi:hypothetical protein
MIANRVSSATIVPFPFAVAAHSHLEYSPLSTRLDGCFRVAFVWDAINIASTSAGLFGDYCPHYHILCSNFSHVSNVILGN